MISIKGAAISILMAVSLLSSTQCKHNKEEAGQNAITQKSDDATQPSLEPSVPPVLGGEKVQPILIITGGFNSCPNGNIDILFNSPKMQEYFELLTKTDVNIKFKKKYETNLRVFFVCYTGSPSLAASLGKFFEGRFNWDDPKLGDTIPESKQFKVPQDDSIKAGLFLNPVIASLEQAISSYIKEQIQPKLYFVGHSYGGYTAIQLAGIFAEHTEELTTIDPISMQDCLAKEFLANPILTILNTPAGCLRAPEDPLSIKSIKSISDVWNKRDSSNWTNHYQDTFKLLHSSAIESDTIEIKNVYYPPPAGSESDPFNNLHMKIALDPTLWQNIFDGL